MPRTFDFCTDVDLDNILLVRFVLRAGVALDGEREEARAERLAVARREQRHVRRRRVGVALREGVGSGECGELGVLLVGGFDLGGRPLCSSGELRLALGELLPELALALGVALRLLGVGACGALAGARFRRGVLLGVVDRGLRPGLAS